MSHETIETSVTVELSDTDLTRFIHFASVVEFFEVGLRTVMETAELTFKDLFDRRIGLPVVNVACNYQNPMMYGDQLTIEPSIGEITDKTMTLDITIIRGDTVTAKGSLTVSFYHIDEQSAIEIPEDIRHSLQSLKST